MKSWSSRRRSSFTTDCADPCGPSKIALAKYAVIGLWQEDREGVDVFLLRKPVKVGTDGFVVTCTPFMIQYDGKGVYAAFASARAAVCFLHAARLDKAYEAVPLSHTDPSELKDADYALLLRSQTQIDRLLAGKITSSGFARNLVPVKHNNHRHGDTA